PEKLLVAVEAPQKLLAIARPEPSAGPLMVTGFEPRHLVSLLDSRLHPAKDSPVPLARGPRCSQGPGPCASSQAKQVVRKYNLEARCGALRFNRGKKCGHSRLPTEAEEHEPKMIRKDEMRHGEQNARQTTPAQVRQHTFDALTESERGIFHARSLKKTASKKHQRHQSDAVGRCPEMQFDQ